MGHFPMCERVVRVDVGDAERRLDDGHELDVRARAAAEAAESAQRHNHHLVRRRLDKLSHLSSPGKKREVSLALIYVLLAPRALRRRPPTHLMALATKWTSGL